MKGFANEIYAVGLVVICLMIMASLMLSLSGPQSNAMDIAVKNHVYLIRDSLDMAKMYVDKSAEYSAYQAMYDNGRNGTIVDIEEPRSVVYDGVMYSLWYDSRDVSPSESDVAVALESAIRKNLKEYTEKEEITEFFTVKVPDYRNIRVSNINDYSMRLEAEGSVTGLVVQRTGSGGEEINMQKPANIELVLNAPYFRIYREAIEYQNAVKDRLAECRKPELEKNNEDRGCCTFDAKVLDAPDGICLVKVNVSTKKKFIVWDSEKRKAVLREISLVFMERAQVRHGFSDGDRIIDHEDGGATYAYQSSSGKWSSDKDPYLHTTEQVMEALNEVPSLGFLYTRSDGTQKEYTDTAALLNDIGSGNQGA